jgi:hypothetical protein
MVNVICLKWGDKYSAAHVNRLYKLVQDNTTIKFNFICFTEDPSDIDSGIQITELPKNDVESYWWKLWILTLEGHNVFFDLDIDIQNNIDEILSYAPTKGVYVIPAEWKSVLGPTDGLTSINSSIMIWDAQCSIFQNRFIQDPNYYQLKYDGNDDFMEQEFIDHINVLPSHWVYCKVWGYDQRDPKRHSRMVDGVYDMPERMICLYNGDLSKQYYSL